MILSIGFREFFKEILRIFFTQKKLPYGSFFIYVNDALKTCVQFS